MAGAGKTCLICVGMIVIVVGLLVRQMLVIAIGVILLVIGIFSARKASKGLGKTPVIKPTPQSEPKPLPQNQSQQVPQSIPQSTPKQVVESPRFCPLCGAQTLGEYCPDCGTKIE